MQDRWLDRPENVKRLWRGFLIVLAALVLVEFAVVLHPHFAVDAVFAFHAWYGFVACAVLILMAKLLGLVLKRPDTYYERRDD